MIGNTALAELKLHEQRGECTAAVSILSHEQFIGDSTIPLIGNLQPQLIRASFHYSPQYLKLIKVYADFVLKVSSCAGICLWCSSNCLLNPIIVLDCSRTHYVHFCPIRKTDENETLFLDVMIHLLPSLLCHLEGPACGK